MNKTTLHLRSKDSETTNKSIIKMSLVSPLTLENGEYFKITLLSFACPYVFYNVDIRNNTFIVTESYIDGEIIKTFTVSIDYGNYNFSTISGLQKDIETQLNTLGTLTYTVYYDTIKNKIIFYIDDIGKQSILNFSCDNSIYEILGFEKTTYTLTKINEVTGNNCCNIFTDDCIYLRCNLENINTIDSKTKSNSDILEKIPIKTNRYGYIYFEDSIRNELIHQTNICNIELRITDEDNKLLDLNGNNYSASLLIEKCNHFDANKEEEQKIFYENVKKLISSLEISS